MQDARIRGAGEVVSLQRFYSEETVPCMELVTGLRLEDLLETDTTHCGPINCGGKRGRLDQTERKAGRIRTILASPSKQSSPYALDKMLDLKPGTSKEDVEQAMPGHTLAAELMGTYRR